jgi:hypothetical protein
MKANKRIMFFGLLVAVGVAVGCALMDTSDPQLPADAAIEAPAARYGHTWGPHPTATLIFHIEDSGLCSAVDPSNGFDCGDVVVQGDNENAQNIWLMVGGVDFEMNGVSFGVDTNLDLSWEWCTVSGGTMEHSDFPDDETWAAITWGDGYATGVGDDDLVVLGKFSVPADANGNLKVWSTYNAVVDDGVQYAFDTNCAFGQVKTGTDFASPVNSCGDCD